jgi:hypothetical protein
MKLASLFSGLLTQPSNERLAFFGLTERVRLLFFVQPLTLPLCRPGGLDDPVICSAKSISPFPLLQRFFKKLFFIFIYFYFYKSYTKVTNQKLPAQTCR